MTIDRPAPRRTDGGFTLIELLVSITILGIIMGAVSLAMMTGLGTNKSTGDRLDESRDEQFVAAYFSADAQGANDIRRGPSRTPACNFTTAGGSLVVEFRGKDVDQAGTVTARNVSYVRRAAPGGNGEELHRLVCLGAETNPASGADTTVARNLSATPTVRCTGTGSRCNTTTTRVDVTLTSGSLSYTLTAVRRTST
ncbi:MAG: prepilin-type N-terminal cleavage/methylation domain-containing protein [Mycobacteriales bacterium]